MDGLADPESVPRPQWVLDTALLFAGDRRAYPLTNGGVRIVWKGPQGLDYDLEIAPAGFRIDVDGRPCRVIRWADVEWDCYESLVAQSLTQIRLCTDQI